jgi:hypothetical protein
MFTNTTTVSPRRSRRRGTASTIALGLVATLSLGVAACDDDDSEPADTVVDELDSDGNVPFDNDVPAGVDTDTNENNNLGFDTDAPGPVGNEANPND